MISKIFNVSDYYELLALHRALLESKFCDEPNDMDISASPLVAKLHKQLVETLMNVEIERKGIESKVVWTEWLKIDEGRREWKVALKRAKNERLWSEWDKDTKITYVKDLLSPFDVDDNLIDLFIAQITEIK